MKKVNRCFFEPIIVHLFKVAKANGIHAFNACKDINLQQLRSLIAGVEKAYSDAFESVGIHGHHPSDMMTSKILMCMLGLPTYKKNTYYFGAGKDFNGAFTDFQNNDSVLFISSMSGQKTSKGENIIYVSYTALQKTSDGKIVHRVVRQEKITCTYGDPNCLNFEGKLSGGLPRDMAKIQDLVPKLQPFLKGPSGSNYNDKELRPGSFNTSLRLTGVADGEISATSFDAVNGKQIWQLKQELGTASEYISVNATDVVASPITSAKAQGARATTVGENVVASGSNSLAIGHNASTTETATNSIALGASSQANEADIVSVGSDTVKQTWQKALVQQMLPLLVRSARSPHLLQRKQSLLHTAPTQP